MDGENRRQCVVTFGEGALVARRLHTLPQRLRGLLRTTRGAGPVLIERCGSVHTCWMAYAIDVALIDREGLVLAVRRALPP